MKKILDFESFLNESSGSLGTKIDLPHSVLKHFEKRLYRGKYEKNKPGIRIISQLENSPLFKELTTRDMDGDGYEEVVMKIDNKVLVIPYLRYNRNSDTLSLSDNFTDNKEIIDFIDLLVSYGLIKKNIDGIKSLYVNSLEKRGYEWEGGARKYFDSSTEEIINLYIQIFINHILDQIKESIAKSTKTFNPFTDSDLYNNPNIQVLQKLGTVIDSSPTRIKKGTIVFKNPIYEFDIAITPTGYIRKAEGSGILTYNPELIKPMYSEDDLNIKLSYLRIYTMKKKLKNAGLSSNEIKEIIDSIGKNPEDYSKRVQELSMKHPQIVSILPPPEEGFDQELKKGVDLLARFGGFE